MEKLLVKAMEIPKCHLLPFEKEAQETYIIKIGLNKHRLCSIKAVLILIDVKEENTSKYTTNGIVNYPRTCRNSRRALGSFESTLLFFTARKTIIFCSIAKMKRKKKIKSFSKRPRMTFFCSRFCDHVVILY